MSQSIVVRVATLMFAAGGLTALVLHGCWKPAPQAATPSTATANATTPVAAAPEASAEPEDNAPFLGATKAAMPMPPSKKKNAAPAQQGK